MNQMDGWMNGWQGRESYGNVVKGRKQQSMVCRMDGKEKEYTIAKCKDKVAVDDSGDTVSDGDDSAGREFLSNDLLEEHIGGRIYGCSCLIQHQQLAPFQQHPPQAEQLPLPCTPVLALIRHCM